MILSALRQAYFELMIQSLDPGFLQLVQDENAYFNAEQVAVALQAKKKWFSPVSWRKFHERYPIAAHPKRVGIIMAGNLPMVGLHDLLAVLMTGHTAVVKPSHKDSVLIRAFAAAIPMPIQERLLIQSTILPSEIDYLIATGSGNTARQLKYTFKDIPQLIRGNRYSVAILSGRETPDEMDSLAHDILLFHGMGCRSISNILVPKGFELQSLADAIEKADVPALHPAWPDLVRWEDAIAQMVEDELVTCSRIHLEETTFISPARPGVLHVIACERGPMNSMLNAVKEQIQCIVGPQHLPFGDAQFPILMDFADDVNTFRIMSDLGLEP
jgi:hypothetical protein